MVPTDHLFGTADAVTAADLADEPILIPLDDVVAWTAGVEIEHRPETAKLAMELVAAGTGALIVPQSLARLYHRKDLTYRPITDAPTCARVARRPGGDRTTSWSRSSSASCGVARPARRAGRPNRRRNARHGRRPSRSRPPRAAAGKVAHKPGETKRGSSLTSLWGRCRRQRYAGFRRHGRDVVTQRPIRDRGVKDERSAPGRTIDPGPWPPTSARRPAAPTPTARPRNKSVEFGRRVAHPRGVNVQLYETPDGFGPVVRWVYRRDPVTFTTELTTLRTSTWPADRVLVAAYDGDGGGRCGGADARRRAAGQWPATDVVQGDGPCPGARAERFVDRARNTLDGNVFRTGVERDHGHGRVDGVRGDAVPPG